MARFIKFFTYSLLGFTVISLVLIIFLSQIGLETTRFNSLITDQVKRFNENLDLDIKKVKIYLDISNLTKPKFKIKSKDPTVILGKNKIEIDYIKTEINVLSYFKDNFILDEFNIVTKNNEIRNLISIASLKKASLIIYNIYIKEGYASFNGNVKFDQKGNIIDYSFNGETNNVKLKFNKKYSFENINFQFFYKKDLTRIKNANFYYKKIKFLSDNIYISVIANDETRLIKGDIRNEKTKINLNVLKTLFKKNVEFIKNQEVIFKSKNKFSFKIKKKKIRKLKYFSQINLERIKLNPKNKLLKNYFNNYNNSILLVNNSIKLKYTNQNLNVEGTSDYSFDTLFDKIKYKINQINNNYDFLTLIDFDHNSLKIEPIEYSKKKNKKSNLKLTGSYNLKDFRFSEIIYKEGVNFFEARNLFLNNNFKIFNLNKIKVDYLNDNNKKNQLNLEKDLNNYNLTGESFDGYKLINNMLLSDNDKSFLDNFNLIDQTKLNISIKEIFLDDQYSSSNLFGKVIIKNNKVHNLNLSSDFSNNKKFKIDIKTLNENEKITSFYSDKAEPFVKHFNFIKGFEDGKINFYSVKINNTSESTLSIFNFKIKEMPVLTKLLSLASLQGIADVMTGEGIRFNEFEMNSTNKNKLMVIDEIYAIGPAISILMDGYIESKNLVSLRGTMVPAMTLNKVIGSIPLIGKILVGKKTGEGVFGVSFKIKGPPKELKTTVNPIKTLTPRFITRTLEKIKKEN